MTDTQLTKLTVIGAGILGGQIEWHSAFRGKNVIVYDLYEEGLEKCRSAHQTYSHIYTQDFGATATDIQGTQGRLIFSTNLQQAVADADIIIECAPEIPDVKTKLFQDMAEYLPDRTIVATNSSTLLPSQFAEATGRPGKFCALHFANLIWSNNIGEVMAPQSKH